MNQFPCINPVCSHLFNKEELTAASLKCPKCGEVIQVRGSASAQTAPPMARPAPAAPKPVAPPAKPMASAPPAAPLARPVPPPAPFRQPPPPKPVPFAAAAPVRPPDLVVMPHEDPLGDLTFSQAGPAFSRRPVASRINWVRLCALAFILVGGTLAVFLAIRRFGKHEDNSLYEGKIVKQPYDILNTDGKPEAAFALWLPEEKSWKKDDTLKKKFKALAAWWESKEEVGLIVLARDAGRHKPREASLIQFGIDALTGVYGETLEMETRPVPSLLRKRDDAKETQLLDNPQKLDFKGWDGPVLHWGEMHFFSRSGVGYVLFLVGPGEPDAEGKRATEKALAWLEEKELGFRVADGRKGWREQPPRMETFATPSGTVELTLPYGVYEKAARIKDLTIPSELTLVGLYTGDKEGVREKDNRKNSRVQVFFLEAHADLDSAMKKATAHIVSQEAPEGAKGYVLEPVKEGPSGKKSTLGEKAGQVGDFVMKVDGAAKRLWVLGVALLDDRACLIACDVGWDNRQVWYDDFYELMKKAKVK